MLQMIVSMLECLVNIWLFIMVLNYRRMFIRQQESFMSMYRLVDRYKERYDALKEDKKNHMFRQMAENHERMYDINKEAVTKRQEIEALHLKLLDEAILKARKEENQGDKN